MDALSLIIHRDAAYDRGRQLVERLREEIPRQMFEVVIQASIGTRINKVFYFKGAVRLARFTRRALDPREFLSARTAQHGIDLAPQHVEARRF